MDRAITLLRISYWVGAVLDAFSVLPLVIPIFGGAVYGIADLSVTMEYRFVSYIGASLMLGWTILLIWADRRPLERRGVLLITVFPVVLGLAFSGLYMMIAGMISITNLVPTLVVQACITFLFLFSYFYAGARQKRT